MPAAISDSRSARTADSTCPSSIRRGTPPTTGASIISRTCTIVTAAPNARASSWATGSAWFDSGEPSRARTIRLIMAGLSLPRRGCGERLAESDSDFAAPRRRAEGIEQHAEQDEPRERDELARLV